MILTHIHQHNKQTLMTLPHFPSNNSFIEQIFSRRESTHKGLRQMKLSTETDEEKRKKNKKKKKQILIFYQTDINGNENQEAIVANFLFLFAKCGKQSILHKYKWHKFSCNNILIIKADLFLHEQPIPTTSSNSFAEKSFREVYL